MFRIADKACSVLFHDQLIQSLLFVQHIQIDVLFSAFITLEDPSVQIMPKVPVPMIVPFERGVQTGDPERMRIECPFQILFINIGAGILLAFTYIMFMEVSNVLATNAHVPPVVAVWIPNVIFGLIGVILYNQAKK